MSAAREIRNTQEIRGLKTQRGLGSTRRRSRLKSCTACQGTRMKLINVHGEVSVLQGVEDLIRHKNTGSTTFFFFL